MEAYYKLFNEKADEFLKDLVNGFPVTPEYEKVISEIKTLKSGFSLLKSVDEKKPQKIFRDYVIAQYRDKIVNADESFFLDDNNDFGITSKKKEYWLDFISKIKLAWNNMSESNKDIIWKYFKLLVFLSDKCDNKTT